MKTTKSIILGLCFIPLFGSAQDKEAELKMNFSDADGAKTVVVDVTSEGQPAKEVEVKLFAERLGGMLELGSATTDESGQATFEFPADLPGDKNNNINVVAKVEENDIYIDTEVGGSVKWGKPFPTKVVESERSLAGGRSNAPIYFIIATNAIIFAIWGTMCYIVYQMFRLRKLGTIDEDNHM